MIEEPLPTITSIQQLNPNPINIHNSSLNGIPFNTLRYRHVKPYLRRFDLNPVNRWDEHFLQRCLLDYLSAHKDEYLVGSNETNNLNLNLNKENIIKPVPTTNLAFKRASYTYGASLSPYGIGSSSSGGSVKAKLFELVQQKLFHASSSFSSASPPQPPKYRFVIPSCLICLEGDHATENCVTFRIDRVFRGITDRELIEVLDLLPAHKTTIREIALYSNRITDVGAKALAKFITSKHGRYLTVLNLTANNVGDYGVEALADAIKSLGGEYNNSIAGNDGKGSGLAMLYLTDNPYAEIGIKAMAKALRYNRTLESLYVNNLANISTDLAEEFRKSILFNLKIQNINDMQHRTITEAEPFILENRILKARCLPIYEALRLLNVARSMLFGNSNVIPIELRLVIVETYGIYLLSGGKFDKNGLNGKYKVMNDNNHHNTISNSGGESNSNNNANNNRIMISLQVSKIIRFARTKDTLVSNIQIRDFLGEVFLKDTK